MDLPSNYADNIPLAALSLRTRQILSKSLNKKKLLLTETREHRDWRGIFKLAELHEAMFDLIDQSDDPTNTLLRLWATERTDASVVLLARYLIQIDRMDCWEDIQSTLGEDAKEYYEFEAGLKRIAEMRLKGVGVENAVSDPVSENIDHVPDNLVLVSPHPAITPPNIARNSIVPEPAVHQLRPPVRVDPVLIPDRNILTYDDALANPDQPLLPYDAMLLYAEDDADDKEFAQLMHNELSARHLRIATANCILSGDIFDHDALRTLLLNRCNYLIVILSPAFLSTPQHKFLTNVAESLAITQQRRFMIPCLRTYFDDIPIMFRYMTMINFDRTNNFRFNNWDRLYLSVKPVGNMGRAALAHAPPPPHRQHIKETHMEHIFVERTHLDQRQSDHTVPHPVQTVTIVRRRPSYRRSVGILDTPSALPTAKRRFTLRKLRNFFRFTRKSSAAAPVVAPPSPYEPHKLRCAHHAYFYIESSV